ncbi:MAG: YggS family pyridoxal phosphate-dependent enzyme [Candidatus Limnocylindrales bacterium]
MEPDPTLVAAFATARAAVLDRIAAACARAGRDRASVTLVAVSKTVEAPRLAAAVAAGLTTLGENRVQEAAAKVALVPGASWHLVGHLQRNKARLALGIFEAIESVDSADLAIRLDRLVGEVAASDTTEVGTTEPPGGRARLPVLLQVNVDIDPAKDGFRPDELPAQLPAILALPHLDVRGLMTVGRLAETPEAARSTFVGLRELAASLRLRAPELGTELSMGMSDDFEVAIEEGATIVRVGRAFFGERPHEHGPRDHDHAH